MNALLGRLRRGNTHFLASKPSLLLLNLNKELKLIFTPHQVYDIWDSVIEKKITQL